MITVKQPKICEALIMNRCASYDCSDLVQVRKDTACTQDTRQCVSSSSFLFST